MSDASVLLRSVSCACSIIHRILTVCSGAELLPSELLSRVRVHHKRHTTRPPSCQRRIFSWFCGFGLTGTRPGHVRDRRSVKASTYGCQTLRTAGTVPGCPGPPHSSGSEMLWSRSSFQENPRLAERQRCTFSCI